MQGSNGGRRAVFRARRIPRSADKRIRWRPRASESAARNSSPCIGAQMRAPKAPRLGEVVRPDRRSGCRLPPRAVRIFQASGRSLRHVQHAISCRLSACPRHSLETEFPSSWLRARLSGSFIRSAHARCPCPWSGPRLPGNATRIPCQTPHGRHSLGRNCTGRLPRNVDADQR